MQFCIRTLKSYTFWYKLLLASRNSPVTYLSAWLYCCLWYYRWLPTYNHDIISAFILNWKNVVWIYANDFQEKFYVMALDKKESIQHATQDGCQSRYVIWSPFKKWPPSWFFQRLQSILNWIILSSYICKVRVQRSGIDTIKYHTWPKISMGKWQTHRRHHKREPRGQPLPSRWPQSTYKQTRTKT